MKTILLKIDEDNDIFEMRIGNEVYTLDNVYQSKYGDHWDSILVPRLQLIKKETDYYIKSIN